MRWLRLALRVPQQVLYLRKACVLFSENCLYAIDRERKKYPHKNSDDRQDAEQNHQPTRRPRERVSPNPRLRRNRLVHQLAPVELRRETSLSASVEGKGAESGLYFFWCSLIHHVAKVPVIAGNQRFACETPNSAVGADREPKTPRPTRLAIRLLVRNPDCLGAARWTLIARDVSSIWSVWRGEIALRA